MKVQVHSCIGGLSIGDDIKKLEHGVHVVSGTPGRVFDMIKRRTLRTRNIKMLVLDEADEMLSKGFKEQIYDVYRYLPPTTQGWFLTWFSFDNCFFLMFQQTVVLVSATLPREVLQMTTKFMNDPIRFLSGHQILGNNHKNPDFFFRIWVKRDELTLEGIKQFFVAVEKVGPSY